MTATQTGEGAGHARGRTPVSALEPMAGLVWAFRIDGRASVEIEFDDESALGIQLRHRGDAWYWFHFDLGDRRASKTLGVIVEQFRSCGANFPESTVDGMFQTLTTPELHFTHGVLHGALLDSVIDVDGAKIGERALLNTVISPSVALTGRRRHLRGVETLRRMARTGHLGARPLALVETLVRTDTAQRESSIERLTDTLNRIEDRVLSEIGEFDRSQIIRIRHSLVRQHRELDGLRRLFDRVDLEIREESGRSDATRAGAGTERGAESTEFGSLLQHLNALVDRCLALLDRARLLQQEVSDQLTVQTNRQLYVLSILTAALVPPTIVVGLFGMNTGGLPLTDTPLGFVAAVALCALSSLLVLGVLAAFGLIRRPRLQWWRRSALHPADAAAFASEDRDISVRGTKSPTASRHRE